MPFILIVAGVVLLIAAVRGPSCGQIPCHQMLFYLLAKDFTGPNNFIFWFVSILIIGAIGYIPKLKPISDGFLVLVIVSLFVRKNGQGQSFITAFEQQISATQSARPVVTAGTSPNLATQSYFIGGGGPGISVGVGSGGVSIGGGGGGITIGGGGGVYIGLPPIGGTGPGGIDPWGGGIDLGGYGPFGRSYGFGGPGYGMEL